MIYKTFEAAEAAMMRLVIRGTYAFEDLFIMEIEGGYEILTRNIFDYQPEEVRI